MKNEEQKISALANLISFILMTLITALPFLWCWNYTMPRLFDLPQINYLASMCIIFMVKFLK